MFARLNAVIAVVTLLSSGALAQGVSLTDQQIAHIAYTASKIDITAAKQALVRSENKDVRAFAADLVRNHEAANKQAIALGRELKVTPKDNEISRTLSKSAAFKTRELSKLKGAAFDKAYLDNEVAYHKTVEDVLETLLIPSASNMELKSLLQTGLKIFQGHKQHAEQVLTELELRMKSAH
jgi:putative membrane protein